MKDDNNENICTAFNYEINNMKTNEKKILHYILL